VKADGSKSRPKQVRPSGQARGAYEEHPDPGYDVNAAFGERPYAPILAPAAAQQGVDAEGEAGYPDEEKQDA
jgi:hypothetical protein